MEDQSSRAEDLERTKAEIAKLSRDLKHCTEEKVLEAELSRLKEKENEIMDKSLSLTTSKAEFSYKLKASVQATKVAQKSLKDLKSAENQKLNQLMKSNSDCYEAVQFLRTHLESWRESGRFKSGIHEPAVLTLTVPDLNNALYIEKEASSQQLGENIMMISVLRPYPCL